MHAKAKRAEANSVTTPFPLFRHRLAFSAELTATRAAQLRQGLLAVRITAQRWPISLLARLVLWCSWARCIQQLPGMSLFLLCAVFLAHNFQ